MSEKADSSASQLFLEIQVILLCSLQKRFHMPQQAVASAMQRVISRTLSSWRRLDRGWKATAFGLVLLYGRLLI